MTRSTSAAFATEDFRCRHAGSVRRRTSAAPATGWSVAAAAERVGVSVSTSAHLGAPLRAVSAGPHRGRPPPLHRRRRRAASAAAPFGRVPGSPRAPRPCRGGAPARPAARSPGRGGRRAAVGTSIAQLREAADDLDIPGPSGSPRLALARHGAVAAWTDVFTPFLQAVGQQWEDTRGRRRARARGHRRRPAPCWSSTARRSAGRPTVAAAQQRGLLAATPTEAHTLPLDALAAALADRRVPAPWCSAHCRPRRCATAIERLRPPTLDFVACAGRSRSSGQRMHGTTRQTRLSARRPAWQRPASSQSSSSDSSCWAGSFSSSRRSRHSSLPEDPLDVAAAAARISPAVPRRQGVAQQHDVADLAHLGQSARAGARPTGSGRRRRTGGRASRRRRTARRRGRVRRRGRR